MAEETHSDKSKKPPHPIDIEFFSKRGNKTTKLINNKDPEFAVEGSHRWYVYNFQQPVYLTEVSVKADGYSIWDKFDVEVEYVDGTKHEEQVPVSGDEVRFSLGKLSKSFSFRPAAKWLSSTKITSVLVSGLTLEEFHDYEWVIKGIEKREHEIAAREDSIVEAEERKKTLAAESSSLEVEIGKSKAELEQLSISVTLTEEQLIESNRKLKDVSSETDTLMDQRRKLQVEIANETSNLQELTREIRLFPSEITGFVKEGDRNIRWYVTLATPFAIILFIII